MPSVGSGPGPGPDHLVDQVGVGRTVPHQFPVEVGEAVGSSQEASGGPQVQAPLARRGGHGHVPALALGAQQVGLVHPAPVEEQLGERRLAVQPAHRAAVQALGVRRNQQVRQAAVALGRRVGPHDAEQPVGPGPPRTPGLLAVQDEPLAVADAPGGDGRQVAAGVGLRPPLGPDLFSGGHAGQEAVLLGLGAEGKQGRAEQ